LSKSAMLKEVLLSCLLGLTAKALEVKPLYHHPVYNVPVYPVHAQPYVIPKQQVAPKQTHKVTTYAQKDDVGTYFWFDMCHLPYRKVAALFDAFDTDFNGMVSFPEANAASLCNVLAGDDPNCNFVHNVLEEEIENRDEWDGQDAYMKQMLVNNILSLFHITDVNNDNLLNMDEFFKFANYLYDVIMFSLRSTRDLDETKFDVISQQEWDCRQNVDEDGLDYPNCNPSPSTGQLAISSMPGNNGDDELDLWEFISVKAWLIKKAKASVHYHDYCSGYLPGSIGAAPDGDDVPPPF